MGGTDPRTRRGARGWRMDFGSLVGRGLPLTPEKQVMAAGSSPEMLLMGNRAASLGPAFTTHIPPQDTDMAPADKKGYKMLAGTSVPGLAKKVADILEVELMSVTCGRFSDGEVELQLGESARNVNVFVLQSTCPPVNENLMELFFMTRCLRRASAKSITAVIPYFGYARQDRKMSARVPISASDVAMLFEAAGVDRVLAVDLHCGQIQGFFHNTPVDNLLHSENLRHSLRERSSRGTAMIPSVSCRPTPAALRAPSSSWRRSQR